MSRRVFSFVGAALAGAWLAVPPALEAKAPRGRPAAASGAPALFSAPAVGQASPLVPEESAPPPAEPHLAKPRSNKPQEPAALDPTPDAAGEPLPLQELVEEEVSPTREGQWTQWDNGRALWKCEFHEGKRHGKATRYFTRGEGSLFAEPLADGFEAPFEVRAVFVQGKLTGPCTIVDSQRRTLCELSLNDDELAGESIWYYPSGQQRVVAHHRAGRLEGERIEYTSEGQLVKEESYLGGRPAANEVANYDNGQKQMRGSYYLAGPLVHSRFDWLRGRWTDTVLQNFPSDVRTGKWTWWHDSGARQLEGSYDEDRPTGTFTWWYPNGQKERQGNYVDGLQSGKWGWWFPSGQKQIEGFYVAGKLTGDWQFWQEDGTLVGGDAAKVTESMPAQPAPQVRIVRQPQRGGTKVR